MQSAGSGPVLVLGGATVPTDLPARTRLVYVDRLDQLGPMIDRHAPSSVVVSALSRSFDYMEVAYQLDQAWFAGQVIVMAQGGVADVGITAEINGLFPSLQVQIVTEAAPQLSRAG